MSDISWDALEPNKVESPLTGPELVVPGKGCRLILKTTEDETGRSDDVLRRLHRAVGLLAGSACPGVLDQQVAGYTRIYGGEPPYYVLGADQKTVIATIGKGILSAPADLRPAFDALGIRALVEW